MTFLKTWLIPNETGNGHYRMFEATNFEYVNPLAYYFQIHTTQTIIMEEDILKMKGLPTESKMVKDVLEKRAKHEWTKFYRKIVKGGFPENLESLLVSNSKKNQRRLLKGLQLYPRQLLALSFVAHAKYNYSLSQYTFKEHVKGLNQLDLPLITECNDGTVNKIGRTPLSDGELKHAIEFQKVAVVKILDNGNNWHCFFVTYKSLKGKESWKKGQAHYHYISSQFGISRQELLQKFKSGKYPSSPIHIDLMNYGNQVNI